jgi:hypothetical protein
MESALANEGKSGCSASRIVAQVRALQQKAEALAGLHELES